jgi:[protein-PII] uridylyltransferase
MIDARLILGADDLCADLTRKLDEEVFGVRRAALLEEVVAERGAVTPSLAMSPCVQEPNVKETAGGLRTSTRCSGPLAWLTARHAQGYCGRRIDGRTRCQAARHGYDFLLRVRNDLHFLTGRRTDLSVSSIRQASRAICVIRTQPSSQASESFMRDYYLHARRLQRICAPTSSVPSGARRRQAGLAAREAWLRWAGLS